MSDEEVKYIYSLIRDYSPEMADEFLYSEDQNAWFNNNKRVLESLSGFTEKYKSAEQLRADKFKALSDLYDEQKSYKDDNGNVMLPTTERIETFKKKHPGIGEDEINEWFGKTNEYLQMYNAEAAKEQARNERKREMRDDWGWRNLVASEYAKQRYLDNPESSLFGKQAPALGEAKNTRYGAALDLGTGVAGAAGDMVPGYGALIGPTLRAARDAGYYFSDSPYKKEGSQIIKDIGTDYATNLAAWKILNARKAEKIAGELTGSNVQRALNAADEYKNVTKSLPKVAEHMQNPTKEALEAYRVAKVPYAHNDIILEQTIKDLPNSSLKTELMEAIKREPGRPINRKAVQDIYTKYYVQSVPYMREAVKLGEETMLPVGKIGSDEVTPFLRNQATSPKFHELGLVDKGRYAGKRVAEFANRGWQGQIAAQGMATLGGRGSKPNIIETALRKEEKDATINRLISSYSLLWNTKNKPQGYDESPIIKDAYDKWKKEQE